jgi:hypothetical protein
MKRMPAMRRIQIMKALTTQASSSRHKRKKAAGAGTGRLLLMNRRRNRLRNATAQPPHANGEDARSITFIMMLLVIGTDALRP